MSEYERFMMMAEACRERARRENGHMLTFYLNAAKGYEMKALALEIGSIT